MNETPVRRIPKCKQCKRKQNYFDRSQPPDVSSSRVDLDSNGLCVDCAQINHTCDRGDACEYERIQDWACNAGESLSLISMLRLCEHHDAIRTAKLSHA